MKTEKVNNMLETQTMKYEGLGRDLTTFLGRDVIVYWFDLLTQNQKGKITFIIQLKANLGDGVRSYTVQSSQASIIQTLMTNKMNLPFMASIERRKNENNRWEYYFQKLASSSGTHG